MSKDIVLEALNLKIGCGIEADTFIRKAIAIQKQQAEIISCARMGVGRNLMLRELAALDRILKGEE